MGGISVLRAPLFPPGTLAGAVPGSAFGRLAAYRLRHMGSGVASLLRGGQPPPDPAPGVPLCPPHTFTPRLGKSLGADSLPGRCAPGKARPVSHLAPPSPAPLLTHTHTHPPPVPPVPAAAARTARTRTLPKPARRWAGRGYGWDEVEHHGMGQGVAERGSLRQLLLHF